MRIASTALLLLALTACSGSETPTPAVSMSPSSAAASTTVGGVTLQTSSVALADLNATIAQRYGIDAWATEDGEVTLAHLPSRVQELRDEQAYLKQTFGDETEFLSKEALSSGRGYAGCCPSPTL